MGFLTCGLIALLASVLLGAMGFTGLARDTGDARGGGAISGDAATGAIWASGLFMLLAFILLAFGVFTMLFINGPGGRSIM